MAQSSRDTGRVLDLASSALGSVWLKTEAWSVEEGSCLRMRRSTKRPLGEVRTMVEVGSEGGGLSVPLEELESQRMQWRIETSASRSGAIVGGVPFLR